MHCNEMQPADHGQPDRWLARWCIEAQLDTAWYDGEMVRV